MKAAPENKTRVAAYLIVAAIAGAAAIYFGFIRGRSGPVENTEAKNRAAEIQASAPAPQNQVPDLPVEKRAPKGARPQGK